MIRTNPDTPLAGVKRYIEVTTKGGLPFYQPFLLHVCGQETIMHNVVGVPFYHYYYGMEGFTVR